MTEEETLSKKELLEGWKFVLQISLEHYNDLTLSATTREKWFKTYTDALYRATTLVRETDTDRLEQELETLTTEIQEIAKQNKH